MGFLRRLFFGGAQPVVHLAGDALDPYGLPVVGESFYQDRLRKVCGLATRTERGAARTRYYLKATLVRDPTNRHDRNAVAVKIAGGQVGHLAREDATEIAPQIDEKYRHQQLECHAVVVGDDIYGVWLHVDPDLRMGDEAPPAPYFSAGASYTGRSAPDRTDAGNVDGKHFTLWVEEVKDLKRAAKTDEAAALLERLIDAVERESASLRISPAAWYYEQLAIVSRKRRDFETEAHVLERYLAFPHPTTAPRAELEQRLTKAAALRARPALAREGAGE